MRLLKLMLAIAAIMLLSTAASAKIEDLEITGKSLEKAAAGSIVDTKLTVNNKGSENLNIVVRRDPFVTLESSWFEYVFFSPNVFTIEGGETQVINLSIKLKKTVPTGSNYKTTLSFTKLEDPGMFKDKDILIRAVPPEEILKAKIDAADVVMPGKEYKVNVELSNNLNAILPETEVFVSSELFEERKQIIMLPWQERAEEFSILIPESTRPGSYTLNARVYFERQLVQKTEIPFAVSTMTDVGGDEKVETAFLWKRITVVRESEGNSPTETSYKTRLTRMEQLFAAYSEEPAEINGEELKWVVELNPGMTYRLSITVNYRPMFWAVLAIAAFTVFAFVVFKRGVSVKKEIMKHHTTHDGMTEIKIRVHLHNHGSKALHDAVLTEILPHHMHPKMEFSTLKPESVEKGERGIRLRWHLDHVGKHEERIITYTLLTKIGVIGVMELHPALLRYKTSEGKIISAKSNSVKFSSGQQDVRPPKEHAR